jgi:ElaB/YqjD/DUF883 family membrane-anchored ribosome-binding protein
MSETVFRYARNGDGHVGATERLAAAAHETVDRVAERASGMEQELRERATVLGKRARKQQKRAQGALNQQVRKARGYVRKQPLRGACIALVVGTAIGALLLRR